MLVNPALTEDDPVWQWHGLPVAASEPKSLDGYTGLCWKVTGAPEPVLRFALRHGVRLTNDQLSFLCSFLKLTVAKLDGQKVGERVCFANTELSRHHKP